MQPIAEPPKSTLPPGARALLNRMEAWAARMIAENPALAEAIRAESAAQAEAERAGQEGGR